MASCSYFFCHCFRDIVTEGQDPVVLEAEDNVSDYAMSKYQAVPGKD